MDDKAFLVTVTFPDGAISSLPIQAASKKQAIEQAKELLPESDVKVTAEEQG